MTSRREQAAAWAESLHDEITAFFTRLDGGGRFREDRWERAGGGGGVARVLSEGRTFEKAGINRSVVDGDLPPGMAQRLGSSIPTQQLRRFLAAGVSLVIHPRSPMVPIVHLNVRYFELTGADGTVADAWLGGGTDLTPTYPFPDDAVHFHRCLRARCERHHAGLYPKYKHWCDDYFVIAHRANERRGVGGIFFDNLRAGEFGLDLDRLFAFTTDVGRILPEAYGPIVDRRRNLPFGERERRFQLFRRGRYVEFNLVYDRGTVFGLQTNARADSVLMSLPPLASWEYAPTFAAGSFEAELMAMLTPRAWADGAKEAP